MAWRRVLKDVVIVIPGITGSVLQKGGATIWGPSAAMIWNSVTSGGDAIRSLALQHGDSQEDDLGDDIVATSLVQDVHLVPGLWKIDGYTGLRELVKQRFTNVVIGGPSSALPANYIEFPYDWRRDNCISARKLKRTIDEALLRWRREPTMAGAKVIVLAHSMGGLIARYWLEALGGWPDCRALISFGTPFRGSPAAVDYLANGYKRLIDLSQTMRSFTSVYQLLPTYPTLRAPDGTWTTVANATFETHIDRQKARDAAAFHRAIELAQASNQIDPDYTAPGHSYRVIPVVGVSQSTRQSVTLRNGQLFPDDALPAGVSVYLESGDGTVPRYSATPLELSDDFSERFIADKHAALQSNQTVLKNVGELLVQMQSSVRPDILGGLAQPYEIPESAALDLIIDDLYLSGEPVEIRARLRDLASGKISEPVAAAPVAHIASANGLGSTVQCNLTREGDGWYGVAEALPAGLYRVTLQMDNATEHSVFPEPVRDVFAIGAAESA